MPSRFSHRLPWNQPSNAYARARQAIPDRELIDLTLSNPTQACLDDLPALPSLNLSPIYTPTAQGLMVAREAIAGYYAENGFDINPDHLIITPGTSVGYEWLFKLFADPGCNILAPTPSYPLFRDLVTLEGLRMTTFRCRYDGRWTIDQDSLNNAWLPSCRAVLWVNPCNPTGQTAEPADREALFRLNTPVVVDEVFADYTVPQPFRNSFVGTQEHLNFVLSGLSKVVGLPQLKISWILVQGPAGERDEVLRKLRWVADTYLAMPDAVQNLLPALLKQQPTRRKIINQRLFENRQALTDSGLPALTSDGGWYTIVCDPYGRDDEKLAVDLLKAAKVAAHPGYFYDLPIPGALVLSLLPPNPIFRSGLEKIGVVFAADNDKDLL